MTQRYRAKRGRLIPMPGSPGRMVPDSGEGIVADDTNPFYARMIADGDLVPVNDDETTAKGGEEKGTE